MPVTPRPQTPIALCTQPDQCSVLVVKLAPLASEGRAQGVGSVPVDWLDFVQVHLHLSGKLVDNLCKRLAWRRM